MLGWPGDPVQVRKHGAPLVVWVVIDEDEHSRREGTGAITSLRDLAALSSIPEGWGIPATTVTPMTSSRLRRLGENAVHTRRGELVRHVRQPLRVTGAVAIDASWDEAATSLGCFVTLAPRVAVMKAIDDRVRFEAAVWGVGLVSCREQPEIVTTPEPPVTEVGPYQWWLAETAYASWLEADYLCDQALT